MWFAVVKTRKVEKPTETQRRTEEIACHLGVAQLALDLLERADGQVLRQLVHVQHADVRNNLRLTPSGLRIDRVSIQIRSEPLAGTCAWRQ